MRGKFITFEGCEGVGKSTQVEKLKEYLNKKKIDFIITREPGGCEISEKIRTLILDANNVDMTPECESLLYAAARAQLVKTVILPALNEGTLVICDRYFHSSFAYQSYARGLSLDFVKDINAYAIDNCYPDLTFFLDMSPKEAFERKGGADKSDRLELMDLEFHNKVYDGFVDMAKNDDRIVTVPTNAKIEDTLRKIVKTLKKRKIIS